MTQVARRADATILRRCSQSFARTDPRWDSAALGVPINQEDLAGTLATFAWLPLEALHRLGVRIPDEDRDAYVAAWGVVVAHRAGPA